MANGESHIPSVFYVDDQCKTQRTIGILATLCSEATRATVLSIPSDNSITKKWKNSALLTLTVTALKSNIEIISANSTHVRLHVDVSKPPVINVN